MKYCRSLIFTLTLALMSCVTVFAGVDLTLCPQTSIVHLGDSVRLGLYACSDIDSDWPIAAMDVVISHSSTALRYTGLSSAGAPYSWMTSSCPTNAPGNINKNLYDGAFMYSAWANLGEAAMAPTDGLLVTTLLFNAQAISGLTEVSILRQYGTTSAYTTVYDGWEPGLDVTGALGSAKIVILPVGGLTSVAQVKGKSDGAPVTVGGPVVTVTCGSVVYIQDATGVLGIRVNRASGSQSITGTVPVVSGTLRTIGGERVIDGATIYPGGLGAMPRPLGMEIRSLRYQPTPSAIMVRLWGRVEAPDSLSSTFTLRSACGDGIRVRVSGVTIPTAGAFVVLTGVLGRDSGASVVWVDSPLQVFAH